MGPQIEEQAQSLGLHVRDFAKLHVDLARTELRDGSTRFALGLVVIAASLFITTLAFVASAIALFFLLRTVLSQTLAATMVALVLALVGAFGFRIGWRLAGGLRSLLLPRTRAMVGEMFTWRDDKTSS